MSTAPIYQNLFQYKTSVDVLALVAHEGPPMINASHMHLSNKKHKQMKTDEKITVCVVHELINLDMNWTQQDVKDMMYKVQLRN